MDIVVYAAAVLWFDRRIGRAGSKWIVVHVASVLWLAHDRPRDPDENKEFSETFVKKII
jgi:hypothetical protein